MCRLIKKQIIRSMPVFVIMCLVTSTVAVGLFFNLDIRVDRAGDNGLALSVNAPEANAQDTASTTVTVLNAAPQIQVEAAENPVSTSSSPINVGDAIGFSITATDPENNRYYLIVCDSTNVTPTNGGAPTCDDTQFCVSAETDAGDPASCTYNNVVDPGSEIEEWYAYACDNHGTEADCSLLSQGAAPGTGDDSSPFYVNHAPTFSFLTTSVDDQDPGGTFTVSGTVTDTDVADQEDEVYLYVCSSNDWSTTTGCADVEWCRGTSTDATAGDIISCDFATTTPALDGTWDYYGFVKDWHELASNENSRTATYTVNNVAPEVANVEIQSGNDITLNMKTMQEVLASTTSTNVTDDNSCMDIVSATGTIYISDAVGANFCADDPNDCYQIQSTECEYLAGSCTGPTDLDATYTCTTTLKFHTNPSEAGGSNPDGANEWLGAITAVDDDGLKGTGTTTSGSGVEINQLLAIEVYVTTPGEANSEITYGSIRGGQDTGDYNATTTVENYGNTPMDSTVDVSDMIRDGGSYYIDAVNQEFDIVNFTYGGGSYAIATTSADQLVDTITPKPTDEAVSVDDEVYWGIGIPGGTLSGDYAGTNTYTATLDESDW